MLRSSLPHPDKSHDTASSSVVSARSSHVADPSQINATPVQSNIVLATETVHVMDKGELVIRFLFSVKMIV